MGSQRIRHNWATELNWTELRIIGRCGPGHLSCEQSDLNIRQVCKRWVSSCFDSRNPTYSKVLPEGSESFWKWAGKEPGLMWKITTSFGLGGVWDRQRLGLLQMVCKWLEPARGHKLEEMLKWYGMTYFLLVWKTEFEDVFHSQRLWQSYISWWVVFT